MNKGFGIILALIVLILVGIIAYSIYSQSDSTNTNTNTNTDNNNGETALQNYTDIQTTNDDFTSIDEALNSLE